MHTVATHRVYGFNKKRLSLNFAGDRGLQKGVPDLAFLEAPFALFQAARRIVDELPELESRLPHLWMDGLPGAVPTAKNQEYARPIP